MSWLENLIGATQSAAGRKPSSQGGSQQRAREQQAVLNKLRSGGSVNLYSSFPLAAGVEQLGNLFAGTKQPAAKAGRLASGQEALIVPGGWGTGQKPSSNLPQEVIVGGQRWFLGQQGQNAAYTRAGGNVGGQYGSIFSADQANAPAAPGSQPPAPGGTNPPFVQPPVKLSPEEQAYNAERSRIAQLTAQNPEFQNIGQLRNDLRDQGMQIWQQKYGNTPMGQPGGAVGRNNPLMDHTFGYQTGSAPDQQMGAPTLGPSPLIPQVDQSLNPASPNFIGGEGAPIMNFADPRFENMSPEEFQKLLNQVNKK